METCGGKPAFLSTGKKDGIADATRLGVIHGENSEAMRSFAGEFN